MTTKKTDLKSKWTKYLVITTSVITVLAGIAQFTGYSLVDFLKKDKNEEPQAIQPRPKTASTTGDNSHAIIADEGDVNISYEEMKQKKDSIINK